MVTMQLKMKVLFGRFTIVVLSFLIGVISLVRFLLYIPSQMLTRKRRRQGTLPPPDVRTFVYEPNCEDAPRDTLLFIHGFPDCADMFEPQVQAFLKLGYRCITVDTPGSRGEPVTRELSPEQIAELIYSAVRKRQDDPVTVVAHDWGALYSIILNDSHPDVVKRMVLIDVGKFQSLQVTELLAIGAYQALLAFLYLLGDPVGSIGVREFVKHIQYDVRPIKEVTADMCFPYYTVFRNPGVLKHLVTENLTVDEKTVPHLFVYGRKKAVRFHDERWVEFVRQTPCGEVVQLACDHWVSVHNAGQFNRIMEEWLVRTVEAANKMQKHEM